MFLPGRLSVVLMDEKASDVICAQAYELFNQRSNIEFLAVLRPAVIGLLSEIVRELQLKVIDEQQMIQVASRYLG